MIAPRAERRLAAILAADVVGYSRLMERDEQGTLERLKAHRREFIDPLIAEHRGRIVKLMGDGALVEFASVVDAVACAVAIQEGMIGREQDVPAAERIRFRIGINLGDVIVEGEDIYGDGVNVAARLEGLAEPGGVLVSGTAYDHLKGRLSLPLEFAGEKRLKNIAEPVRAYRVRLDGKAGRFGLTLFRRARSRLALPALAALLALVVAAGTGWWLETGEPPPKQRPGIAVLPFDNLGGDEATGRLADGLTEDVITDLARFRDLDVIARNSTEVYKGKPVDVRRVGEELGVGYVLEGSIQRQGERVRVTAQLIDAGSGAHVWSERWDRPAEDVFAIQAEVAERVASSLGGYGLVAEAGRPAARRKPPANLTAYDAYLLGSEAKHRLTKEGVDEAVRLLRRAVELDPQLARAWTGLTWAYAMSANWAADEKELRQAALDAARRAVQLDPTDAEAHVALGEAVAMSGGDLGQAEVEFEKALQLNPSHINVLHLYAAWASSFGKPEKGAEAAERLIHLNPNYPAQFVNGVSYGFFMVGRYEDALRALARRPEEGFSKQDYLVRAGSLAGLGRIEEAKAVTARASAHYPGITVETWINTPGFIEHERQRFAATMRAAGFPACASPEELAKFEKPIRLPECEAERAKVAASKN